MKSGFLTSEFWLRVLGGAICAGMAYFGISENLYSIIAILAMVESYAWNRFFLKKNSQESLNAMINANPAFKEDIINVIQPVIDKYIHKQPDKFITETIIKHEVNKL